MISKHRIYMFLQLIIVLLVIISFRVVPEKRVASLLATSLFLIGAAVVIFTEGRTQQGRKSLSFISTSLFVVLFVCPIIFLRVISWDGSFEQATLMGLTGAQFHRFSNSAFMIMLACYFFESVKAAKKKALETKNG